MWPFITTVSLSRSFSFFFFNDPATTEIYTLSLHDALPISLANAYTQTLGAIFSETQKPYEVEIAPRDRKSTRLNSSHVEISYAVFCLKKKKKNDKEAGKQNTQVDTTPSGKEDASRHGLSEM